MKIRVIHPIITNDFAQDILYEYRSLARKDTEISISIVERGPASIESQYDVAVALPDILKHVDKAQKENMDAVIINCMADPGLDAARELASIPVIGMGEASLHLASILAHKFSVITILERDIPDLDRMFRKYDVYSRVASVKFINVPVLDLRDNEDAVAQAATEASIIAVKQDGAAAIAFGCGGLTGVVVKISNSLKEIGIEVPVINPTAAAIKMAESLVDMQLVFSKKTYPYPPKKKIIYPIIDTGSQ